MRKSLSVLNVALAIVLTPTLAICEGTPCHDSDGDSWADPEAATDSCPPDNCPGLYNFDQANCHNTGDPLADGIINVQDVVKTVEIAFRGQMPAFDSACAELLEAGTDNNCDGNTDVVDVVTVVNVAFRGQPENFCKPCLCDCFPNSCPETVVTGNLIPHNGSFEHYCRPNLEGWTFDSSYITIFPEPSPSGGEWSMHIQADWSWWGWAEFAAPQSVPGGIYRVSAYYRARIPESMSGSMGTITLRYASHTKREVCYSPNDSWQQVWFTDTIPSIPGEQLKLHLEASNSHIAMTGEGPQFDRVVLEYLGQPDP